MDAHSAGILSPQICPKQTHFSWNLWTLRKCSTIAICSNIWGLNTAAIRQRIGKWPTTKEKWPQTWSDLHIAQQIYVRRPITEQWSVEKDARKNANTSFAVLWIMNLNSSQLEFGVWPQREVGVVKFPFYFKRLKFLACFAEKKPPKSWRFLGSKRPGHTEPMSHS